ncbi:MAG: helix-turn-helix domain-containing protein [Bacteroidota bacterium]
MEPYSQILFFLAVVGAFNGLFLSVYFAFFVKHRNKANYFLSALLFVIGFKIIISVFLNFNHSLSEKIVIVGFLANMLIGPFFYLYVKSSITEKSRVDKYWWLHVVVSATAISLIGALYPAAFSYADGVTKLSQYIAALVHFQWFVYLILTALLLKDGFRNVLKSGFKLNNEETWLVSLFMAIAVFWLGPLVTTHTTYMVGALSFSMIFYTLVFLWVFKFRKTSGFFDPQIKYATKKIDAAEAQTIAMKLDELFSEKELFRNPNLKIAEVAEQLPIPTQRLSQFLNDNLGKSFSLYINEYRIEAAKEALAQNNKYTLEVIGYECGFNSKSTFFTTFKSITGLTPANFKAQAK